MTSLAIVACCSCTGGSGPARAGMANSDSGRPATNLTNLLWRREVVFDEATRLYSKMVTLFFDPKTGRQVTGINLVLLSRFSDGLAVAQEVDDGPYGYVDQAGHAVIAFRYCYAEPFNDGRAVVTIKMGDDQSRVHGLIDRAGKWIVQPGLYDKLGMYRDGCCPFKIGKLWGLLDGNGKIIVRPQYKYTRYGQPTFHAGLAAFWDKAGRLVYIDSKGRTKFVAPSGTLCAYEFNNDRAMVEIAGGRQVSRQDASDGSGPDGTFSGAKFGYIDLVGRLIIAPAYSAAGPFSEGLAPVSPGSIYPFQDDTEPMAIGSPSNEKELWGFIDVSGNIAIPFTFARVGSFSEGLARVRKGGRWGYIDKKGHTVVPCEYEWARDFRNGFAEVWCDDKVVYIDRTGRIVVHTDLSTVTF